MKVKTISRGADFARERSGDIYKVQRNLDPELHPFERAREYTRALNAVKLERMFAKPFVGALSGHIDGVYCVAKHPTKLTTVFSGSADGEVRIWSLTNNKTTWSTKAHHGFVRGICSVPFSDNFFTVGEDKTVKMWSADSTEPLQTYASRHAFNGVDHHRTRNTFATSSTQIDIWDHQRAEPVQTFSWGAETTTSIKFNQTETSIFATCGTDRTIILYDLRTNSPLSKTIMAMRTNAIAWNPMEAFNFTIANEDHNCYTFDMRKMQSAMNVHKDHVSAVLDIDYSPSGEEFVTGGYDRTVRIFKSREGHSRDVYHTKRMQRIFCVKFSMDAKFVLSGSDDGNIRLWKAGASDKLGTTTNRERAAVSYTKAVKERYKHMPEIRRIDKHRRIPKAIIKAKDTKRVMTESIKRKEENLRKHTKEGAVPYQAERKKNVLVNEK
ncbi:WD40-repeat-containing domain protein [Fimicolochytrium jonesii]|uniref:WD40-repeat-containing domain protein n=1 Tax=Fimicolochytrium jonesii TaxID=1396493 RepID=UPI0022FDF62C|nr:WD40-repeat-containing domain protein [Fimicolochytrium jonesii]KAI8820722.1 WD40-repeat-containing domain protein [Fimicolochytrium jonesii]